MSQSKYRAKPCMVGDIRFASQAEARRYQELLLLNKAGAIRCLELQPRFPIVVYGMKVTTYVADFKYIEGGREVIEDVKSEPTRTQVYRLKKKLMKAVNGIEIREVTA